MATCPKCDLSIKRGWIDSANGPICPACDVLMTRTASEIARDESHTDCECCPDDVTEECIDCGMPRDPSVPCPECDARRIAENAALGCPACDGAGTIRCDDDPACDCAPMPCPSCN